MPLSPPFFTIFRGPLTELSSFLTESEMEAMLLWMVLSCPFTVPLPVPKALADDLVVPMKVDMPPITLKSPPTIDEEIV